MKIANQAIAVTYDVSRLSPCLQRTVWSTEHEAKQGGATGITWTTAQAADGGAGVAKQGQTMTRRDEVSHCITCAYDAFRCFFAELEKGLRGSATDPRERGSNHRDEDRAGRY